MVHYNLKTILELQKSKYLKIANDRESENKIHLKYCLSKEVNENRE
jgi:hypothetical protein